MAKVSGYNPLGQKKWINAVNWVGSLMQYAGLGNLLTPYKIWHESKKRHYMGLHLLIPQFWLFTKNIN